MAGVSFGKGDDIILFFIAACFFPYNRQEKNLFNILN